MDEDKKGRTKKKAGSIRSVFMHADGVDKCLMFLGILGAMVDGVSTPVLLFISSRLMNDVGTISSVDADNVRHSINQNALNLVYLASVALVGAFLEGYCWTRTGERQAARMRARYLKAVLRQEVSYFDLHVTGMSEVITSVSNDTIMIQDVIAEKVPNFLVNVTFFFSSYIVGFILLWRLAIVGFPLSLLLVVPGLLYGRTLMEIARKIRAEYVKAETIAVQAVSSVRTVYAFTGEKKTISEFSTALQGGVKLGLRQGLAKGLAIGSNSLVFANWSFMAYYSSKMIMYHGTKGGTAYAVGSAITMGGVALGASLGNLRSFSDACSAGKRISEVIMRKPRIDPDNEDGYVLTNLNGNIEFRHVDFAYPSRPETIVFKGFCLSVPAEKTLALVGSSGSGKSTVISLLQRFYDPLDGEITLDGVCIDKLQIKWLRAQLGLVSQEPTLFATSIKENILFGKEDASMEEIFAAAKASNAHNFISHLPQGYDTQVGERGIQLSGGQKQRIAIARAIIKSPRILLLDEATSALDSESEKVVQEALENASVGRTTIIVAHRLSTVRHTDNIVVIQNGQVVESGSHEELIQNPDGMYTSLVNLQLVEKHDLQDGMESRENQSAIMSSSQQMDQLGHSSRGHTRISHSSQAGSTAASHNNLPKKKQPVPSFWRLAALNLPEWKQAIVACISAILFGAVQPVYSFTAGSMIWVFFLKDHKEMKEKIKFYSLAFVGLAVFSLVINITQHYSFAFMGENLTKRIRERMLTKVLTFEVGWFDEEENSSGSICSRLSKDASIVRSLVGDRMSLIVQTASAIGFAFSISLVIAWRLSIVIIACQPVIIVCIYVRRVLLKSISKKAVEAQGESSKLAAEAVANHRTITAFSSQDRVLAMLKKTHNALRRESVRQSWFAGIGLGISQFMTKAILAFSFWYAGKLITEGHVSPKAFFETLFMLLSTGRVIADAGSMTSDLTKGAETVNSVFNILDRATKIEPEEPESYEPKAISGHVEFREIDFAYPARPDVLILKGFSFMVETGKSTALVGQSGSGKSTLIGLIERYYDPINGAVYIDGRDLRTFKMRSLRKHISLVSQEPTLFAGTIRENICYGMPGAQETEIVEAAKVANAHEFIVGMKDGYDTPCGDKGVQLSGGQKQRVAIARAVLRNPSLLLLDEATSALDTRSEHVVQNALERLMVGRTSLVIAHRLSTIQNCDVIAVLDKGEVVEKGSHSSLLTKGPTGAYYSLVNLQTTSPGGS